MDLKNVMKISAVAGAGMIVVGAFLYYRERKAAQALQGLRGGRYLGDAEEAPVVGGYSNGGMRTQLRASRDMPIEQRLATIQRKVRESVQDPEMRKLALQITSKCPERDKVCEAKAIYHATKKRIRYTGDVAPVVWEDGSIEGIDLYQSARRTWFDMLGGDCDDQAILNSTLLSLNGIPAMLRVTAESHLDDWSHIYAVGQLGNMTLALDTTLPGKNRFGVEAPYAKKKDFPA